MTIAEVRQNCKNLIARVPRDALLIGILILASLFSFGLGYLAGLDAGLPAQAGQGTELSLSVSPAAEIGAPGQVLASKNGAKYYPQDCPAARRISEANKVWFASAAAAEAAGYARAANCEGF